MHLLTWLVAAWVGGTAAILGSLMALASILLWWVPSPKSHQGPLGEEKINRLKVTTIALIIAVIGWGLLLAVPFPNASP